MLTKSIRPASCYDLLISVFIAGAESHYDDVEYLINVQVSGLNVTLNLDTRSADL